MLFVLLGIDSIIILVCRYMNEHEEYTKLIFNRKPYDERYV